MTLALGTMTSHLRTTKDVKPDVVRIETAENRRAVMGRPKSDAYNRYFGLSVSTGHKMALHFLADGILYAIKASVCK